MAKVNADETRVFLQVSYLHAVTIPVSVANVLLEHMEIWKREYKDGAYIYQPALNVTSIEMHTLPSETVIAGRMLSAMEKESK